MTRGNSRNGNRLNSSNNPQVREKKVPVLNAEEIEGLQFMIEEEKLAHDVYTTLGEQWGLPIFTNIANSEQRHLNAVDRLLDKYNLEDPITGNAVGVFENEELQNLYDNLIAQGQQSLEEALKVGILIEETDIIDLEEYMEKTDNINLDRVYQNLLNGSLNHLEAFTSTLERIDSLDNQSLNLGIQEN